MKNFNKFLLTLILGLMTTATVMAQNVILSEGFESGVIPTGWTTIDTDNDGRTWTPGSIAFSGYALSTHTGVDMICSASFDFEDEGLTPDNYLVTPQLNIPNGAILSYWISAQDADYPEEHYGVFASTGGNTAADFTVTLFEETMTAKNAILKNKKQEKRNGTKSSGTWYQRTVLIPANTKYIAFRHYNCTDQFYLNLDDVTITDGDLSCPSITNLSAIVNADSTVTLTWTNPPESMWPSNCEGDLVFVFSDEANGIGNDGSDDLTTWTTGALSPGIHNLEVIVEYYDNNGYSICKSDKVTIIVAIGVNINRYITLSVQKEEKIKLDLWADAENTPIKVVSGSYDTTLTIGTDWTGFNNYYAEVDTMRVYGNIQFFDCSNNGSNIKALDPSNNIKLKKLYCRNNNLSCLDLSNNIDLIYLYCIGNNFTTQTYDDLMCSLPLRNIADNAWLEPLYNTNDTNTATFLAANSANATNKNWKVQYYQNASEISTTGNYDCSSGINNIAAITATLYPNPVKDLLNIISDSEITGYELYDALGRMLINETNLSDTESVINLSSLENGIYILKLRSENGTAEYKIVKSE